MSSKRRVLVCDLDETLIHSVLDTKEIGDRVPDFMIEPYSTYKRPFVDIFLLFAKECGFEFAVFTTASALYAEDVVNNLFAPLGIVPIGIFSKEHCIMNAEFGDYETGSDLHLELDNKARPGVATGMSVKPLVFFWNWYGISLDEMIHIDDIPTNASYNPDNLLYIPPWNGESNDNELLKLMPIIHVLSVAKEMILTLTECKRFYLT